jgi:hypothetical protein
LRRGEGLPAFILLLLLAFALPVQARPQVVVVIADHLTLADALRADLPGFVLARAQGQIALMSPGVAHGADPERNVFAALGAGDSIQVGNRSEGRLDATLRGAGIRTALIGNADGDDTGVYQPAREILPVPDLVFDPTVPAPTVPGGRRNDPGRLWAETQTALISADCVVDDFGDFDRSESENFQGDLAPRAYTAHRAAALRGLDDFLRLALPHLTSEQELFLVVPTPPLDAQGHWDRLTPILRFGGSGQSPGGTLTSDTTQTVGLVAARDVAPSVLAWLRIPLPIQMTGAAIRPMATAADGRLLRRLDRQTRLNQDAQIPLFWGIGLIAPALIFSLAALYRLGHLTPGTLLCRFAPYAMRLLAAWPLALLLAPLVPVARLDAYLGVIVVGIGLLALLPSPTVIFSLTALALIADSLLGTRLAAQSVLSSYALAGIRFYGIGNEYMGLLIGGALLFVAAWPPKRGADTAALLWFALVTLVLSCPAFGAKAGGAVTATAIFTLAWLRLRGVPIRARHVILGIATGFALVFFWAAAGSLLHLRRTHLASAVGAVHAGRFGYILGIALRKIGLSARVFLHGGTLLGLLALAIAGFAGRRFFQQDVAGYFATRPRLAAVSEAGLWGCGIAIVFNDSGIVAAILLSMCLILPVIHGLFQNLCNSCPSTLAMSESESPSAIF